VIISGVVTEVWEDVGEEEFAASVRYEDGDCEDLPLLEVRIDQYIYKYTNI
jgi:hypothetical protein